MSRHVLGVPVEPILPSVAAHLAHLDDSTQAAFFEVFAKELMAACGTRYAAELQLSRASDSVTPAARELLAMLAPEVK